MDRKWRRFSLLGGGALSALVIAACGAPAPAAAPAAPAAAVEVSTIDVMHAYGEGVADQPMMVEWGKQFESLNPQYKLKWTWGGSEMGTLFTARMGANDPPDLVITDDGSLANQARDGVIQPITKYLDGKNYEGDATWRDTFYAGVLSNGRIKDGKAGDGDYGIPDNMHFGAIWYDKGLFEKHSYVIPKTWSELMNLCGQIMTDESRACFGADNYGSYNSRAHLLLMWRMVGGQKVFDTGMGKPGTKFDTPEFLKAAQLYQELTTKHFVSGWEGNQWPAGQVAWSNHDAAMIFMPSWLPSELMTAKAEDFVIGAFPMPSVAGGVEGKPDLEVKFNGWVVPTGAKNPDGAMAWAKFATSKAYQIARTNRADMPSPLKTVPLPETMANMQAPIDAASAIRFGGGWDAEAPEWQAKVLEPLNTDLAMGKITPEDFLKKLDVATAEFYKK